MFFLILHRATGQGCAAHFYPATIPAIVQPAAAAVVALAGLVLSRWRFRLLVASSAGLGLLGVPALFAGLMWPGGDDGGGFGWLFIVGGGCAMSFGIGLATCLLGLIRRQAGPERPRTGRAVRILLWAMMAGAAAWLAWIAYGPVSWMTERTVTYAGGVEIRNTDRHEVVSLFPLPVYHSMIDGYERTLLLQGREAPLAPDYKHLLFPSPAGTYVVAEDYMFHKPLLIFRVADSQCTPVEAENSKKEFPGHYNVYPFHFEKWEDDETFLVEVTGLDLKGSTTYPQVWRFAAGTGRGTRVK
jgi:hypothetical protein